MLLLPALFILRRHACLFTALLPLRRCCRCANMIREADVEMRALSARYARRCYVLPLYFSSSFTPLMPPRYAIDFRRHAFAPMLPALRAGAFSPPRCCLRLPLDIDEAAAAFAAVTFTLIAGAIARALLICAMF